MPSKGHRSSKSKEIIALFNSGKSLSEIQAATSYTYAAVYDVLRQDALIKVGTLPHHEKYDWDAVQQYYDLGNSLRDCAKHFKMNKLTPSIAVRRGRLKTRSISEAVKLRWSSGRHILSSETRKKLSDNALKNRIGGETNYRKCQYHGVYMDSQWEVDIAIWMDGHNVLWQRGKHLVFDWNDAEGHLHRYYPDFYLPDYNIYLDPKNKYLIGKDRFKIETVMAKHNIRILWGLKDDVLAALNRLL